MDANNVNLASKDASLTNEIAILGDKLQTSDRKFVDRIDDVVAQVNQRALDTRLSDVEKRLVARDEFLEIDFTEFKDIQTKKIEDAYDSIQEVESSIFTHE